MTNTTPSHLIIVGGGASGGIALIKSVAKAQGAFKITILDPSEKLGLGRAYSTSDERHLLNVPADKMSVLSDEPLDFVNWLKKNQCDFKFEAWPFVPRIFFGEYLRAKIKALPSGSYTHARTRAKSVNRSETHWDVETEDKKKLEATDVIFATGYRASIEQKLLREVNDASRAHVIQPYDFEKLKIIGASDDILIVGTGLTAMDVLMHLHDKTSGQIQFISRHAFFPKPHSLKPPPENLKDLPGLAGKSPLQILKIFKSRLKQNPTEWIALMNQMREPAPGIWSAWSASERDQFIRHAKSYWEVARHRLPEPVFHRLQTMRADGRVKVHAGRISSTEKIGDELVVKYLPRGEAVKKEIRAKWIILATDAKIDQQILTNSAESKLRKSTLGMGYVDEGASHLWLLGPPGKEQAWETTAIPEIVKQADQIMNEMIS